MTTQTLARTPRPTGAATVPGWTVPRLSWRSVGHDLAYLTSSFFVTLFSFILLVTLFAVGVSTLVLWVGAPILGFMVLTATGFARENRELLRRWGTPVAEPAYRGSGRRVLVMLADPKAWFETLHGTLVAFPLRLTTFLVPVTWIASALGGLTWFVWGRFLPDDDVNGLGWLLTTLLDLEVTASWYLVESVTMFVAGALFLVTAPLVTRLCAHTEATVARAMLGGLGSSAGREDR